MRKYDDPAKGTRRWITVGLVLGGAVAGAAFGIVLTPLGKIVAGAPPADAANYIWNAWMFAAFGAGLAPLAGAAIGALLASPALFLLGFPLGATAAALRLALTHRPSRTLPP